MRASIPNAARAPADTLSHFTARGVWLQHFSLQFRIVSVDKPKKFPLAPKRNREFRPSINLAADS